jgi:NFACT protein RNA binding domain
MSLHHCHPRRLLPVSLAALLSTTAAFSIPRHRIRCTTQLQGVLSRSAILSAVHRETYITAAVQEALFRQDQILQSLERQDPSDSPALLERRNNVTETHHQLLQLQATLSSSTYQQVGEALQRMGFTPLLLQPARWGKWMHESDYGRPANFGGLVFYYNDQIPILVGRHGAHSDDVLRQIAQGPDLWLQVSDYQGSRVLIRYSLARGQKDNRQALRLAANLAAYFSNHRHSQESVPVIYTHSKLVAKRGSRKGTMKRSKRLGTLMGRPKEVVSLVDGREP